MALRLRFGDPYDRSPHQEQRLRSLEDVFQSVNALLDTHLRAGAEADQARARLTEAWMWSRLSIESEPLH